MKKEVLIDGKMQHVDIKWNSDYYFCNQVPCRGCNLCLDFAETLAFFFLDPLRRRLPLDCELAEDADRGRLGTNEREDWGVTCGAGTERVGFSKIERLPREEEDSLGTDMPLPGEEGCEEAAEW